MPSLRVRVDPVEKVTSVSILKTLTEPEQRKAAAMLASEGIEEAKDQNKRILGRVPPYKTTVDGREGAPLESVDPVGGRIITEFELVNDVLLWIMSELREASPVVSGHYRDGHTLFVDGVEIAVGEQVPDAEEYVIANLVPYARKIEVGQTRSGRAFVIQVPNHIYERTAQKARARFGNIMRIEFNYRVLAGGRENRTPAIILRTR